MLRKGDRFRDSSGMQEIEVTKVNSDWGTCEYIIKELWCSGVEVKGGSAISTLGERVSTMIKVG